MLSNKDKGTGVGFSNDEILQHFGIDCEISSGVKGEPIDFHISENLEQIEKNIEDEFVKWLDEIIESYKEWMFSGGLEESQRQVFIQVKKKYLDIKKNNI